MSTQKKISIIRLSVLLAVLVFTGCKTMDLMKVEVMLSQENYSAAIPVLKDYVAENPDSVRERSKLGFAYLKTGRIDEAIDTLEKTIEIQPGEPYAVLYLGLAYINKEKYSKAIDVWQGLKDPKRPLIEAEIKRLTTLIQIADSQRAAMLAIANEKAMRNEKLDESTVAVCYYKDVSQNKELQGFQKGLAAMVISDLSKIKSLTIVERIRMQALLQEMKLGQTGIVDQKTAPRVGRLIGAENLVVGTLSGDIQVTTTLASSSTGKIKGTTAATISKAAFFEIPKGIVLDTAKIMGVEPTDEEKAAIGTPHTKNYSAALHYGLALDALDAGHWEQAKDLFAKALREDPQFKLAKNGHEACPSGSSPTIGQLAAMTATGITSMAETTVDHAIANQVAADQVAAETGLGGGGGGGGGH